MDEMKEMLTRLDERTKELASDVRQMKYVLIEGNGTPAMTVRLAVAENELERLKEERVDKKMPRAAWVAILLSTIVSVVAILASIA